MISVITWLVLLFTKVAKENMQKQRVFKAGNSNVVSIPKHLARELGIRSGQKVVVDKTPDNKAIIIRKANDVKVRVKSEGVSKEFKKWLENVLTEDAEILDELAVR